VLLYRCRVQFLLVLIFDILCFYVCSRLLLHNALLKQKNLLTVPHLSLALSAEAFCVSAPTVWNSLSDACREAELVSIFRSRLKTELFNVAYVSKLV